MSMMGIGAYGGEVSSAPNLLSFTVCDRGGLSPSMDICWTVLESAALSKAITDGFDNVAIVVVD